MMLLVIVGLASFFMQAACSMDQVGGFADPLTNASQSDKDLYVIQATVYQVGILTNGTDNSTKNYNSTGSQSSITLYNTKGNGVDLSTIPEPLMTNVTAQSIIGVAPVSAQADPSKAPAWGSFDQLRKPTGVSLGNVDVPIIEDQPLKKTTSKRSLDHFFRQLFKRDTTASTPVKMVNGTALIPPEVGLQSIGLPPLFSLNNNFSDIPVPIPNTSVIHYAKVDTLIQKPQ